MPSVFSIYSRLMTALCLGGRLGEDHARDAAYTSYVASGLVTAYRRDTVAQVRDRTVEDLAADAIARQQRNSRHVSSTLRVWVVMMAAARSAPTRVSRSCSHGATALAGPGWWAWPRSGSR